MTDSLHTAAGMDARPDEIYRVTPLQKDAKRDSGRSFGGQLNQEEEENAKEEHPHPPLRNDKNGEDVALLSEMALEVALHQTEEDLLDEKKPDHVFDGDSQPGSRINIQA